MALRIPTIPDFQVKIPELPSSITSPALPKAYTPSVNLPVINLPVVDDRFNPTTKSVSFGAAPDPYADPAGFAEWFNNIQNTIYPTTPTFEEWNKSQSSPIVMDKSAAGYSKDAMRAARDRYNSLYPNTNLLETTEYLFDKPQTQGLLVDYVNGAGVGGTPGRLTEEAVKANLARDPLYYANLLAGTQAGNTTGSKITSSGGVVLGSADTLPTTNFGQMIYSDNPLNNYLLTPQQLYNELYSGDQYQDYVGQTIPEGLRQIFGNSDTQLYPNQQIRIVDKNGVIHSGNAAEMAAANQGQFSPEELGNKLYSYQVQNPTSGDWNTVYTHVPEGPSWFESFLTSGLPMIGAAFMPMLAPVTGALGSTGAAALGAALGSTGAGIATGKSIGDIAKNAALSGALTYAGGELFKNLGGGTTPTSGGTVASNVPASQVGDIVITGSRLAAPVGSTLASAFNSANTSNQSSSSGEQVGFNPSEDIVLTAQKMSGLPNVGGAIGTRFSQPFQTYNAENYVPRQTTTDTATEQTTTDGSEIVVTGREQENLINSLLGTGSIGPLSLNYSGKPVTDAQLNEMVEKNMSQIEKDINSLNANQILGGAATTAGGMTLKDIATYLRLAGYGGSLATALLGGGSGNGSGSGKPAYYNGSGTGSLNPIFSGTLPPSSFGGGTGTGTGTGTGGGSLAPRPPSEIGFGGTGTGGGTGGGTGAGGAGSGAGSGTAGMRDWTQYGFGPEASFFEYVPVRGYSHGGDMSEGRSSFAVRGPGDGRSDDIPAVLSDGEYVMDAETVALLGNGSSEAGADALDRFRINLRKHKGKKLAKGEFSVDAKRPEQYLAGGRI